MFLKRLGTSAPGIKKTLIIAQLTEQLLPTLENMGSNALIGKFC